MEKRNNKVSLYKRLLEITWLIAIFLIPLFFNPFAHQAFYLYKALLLQLLVMAMLAFWVADRISSPGDYGAPNWRGIFSSPLHISILVFGLIVALATAASITPSISFWGSYYREAGLLTLLCWILFFLIVAQQLRSRAQLFRAIYILLLSSGIVSVIGIIQHFFPSIIFNRLSVIRVFSTSGNALSLSSFLVMVVPFTLAIIAYSWGTRKEGKNTVILSGSIILLALQFWCLWLAQYSITILLYVIAPVAFLILLGVVKRNKLLLGLGATSLVVLGIIAILLLTPLLLTSSNVSTSETMGSQSLLSAEEMGLKTLDWRVQYWRSATDIITKSPEVPFSNDSLHNFRRVIGYGPETFIVTIQLFFPDKLKSDYNYLTILLDNPHNNYLYLATTVGLLGLMSFLSVLAVFFYLCFRYLRRTRTEIEKLLLIAMASAMIQYIVDIFFNVSTLSPELVFWLALAITPAIGRFSRNEKPAGIESKEVNQTKASSSVHKSKTRFIISVGCAITLITLGVVITVGPFMADMYLQKGLNLQRAGSDQAIYAFEKATRLNPGESTYWYSLGVYEYSVARGVTDKALKEEMLTLATDAYTKSLMLRPYVAVENYALADVYTYWAETADNDKWPMALSLYDKASQLLPRYPFLLDRWSLALIIKGDLDEAKAKLDEAASITPDLAETSFLSGLLLSKEDKIDEAGLKVIAPVQNDPTNLISFLDFCFPLSIYNIISPMRDILESRANEVPNDWTGHAMLGIVDIYDNDLDNALIEFNTSMSLIPDEYVVSLFTVIGRISSVSPQFRAGLQSIAGEWRDKIAQSPDRDTLLPLLDQLTGASK